MERNASRPSEHGKLPPEDLTLIQIGTRGKWNETPFEVTGRMRFEFEDDSYVNWWHLESGQSSFAWLAESYATFRLMKVVTLEFRIEELRKLSPGDKIRLKKEEAFILGAFATTLKCWAEGELPMAPKNKRLMWLDFSSEKDKSIDIHIFNAKENSFFKEENITFFMGEDVSLEQMNLTNRRKTDGWIG